MCRYFTFGNPGLFGHAGASGLSQSLVTSLSDATGEQAVMEWFVEEVAGHYPDDSDASTSNPVQVCDCATLTFETCSLGRNRRPIADSSVHDMHLSYWKAKIYAQPEYQGMYRRRVHSSVIKSR